MPRLQFSLRTLLLTTLMIPCAVSVWLHRGPVQKKIKLDAGPLFYAFKEGVLDLEFATGNRIVAAWPHMFAIWTPDGQRQLARELYDRSDMTLISLPQTRRGWLTLTTNKTELEVAKRNSFDSYDIATTKLLSSRQGKNQFVPWQANLDVEYLSRLTLLKHADPAHPTPQWRSIHSHLPPCPSPDGSRELVATWNDAIIRPLSKTADLPNLDLFGHGAEITILNYSSDCTKVITADTTGIVIIWNSSTAARLHTLNCSDAPFRALEFSPDAKYILNRGNIYGASPGRRRRR